MEVSRALDAARGVPQRVQDGLTFLAAAGGCLAVPALLHGFVHVRSWAVYRLMWLNLVGHQYRMPIDTPKPLLVLRAGLPGETAYFVVALLAFALLAVVFRRVARALTGRGWPGLVAFALVFLGNRYVLPGPFLIGYWPVVYFTFVAAGGWLVLEGRWDAAFAVVGVSGLIRPESWALAGAMLVLAAWRDPGRLRWVHVLSLAAAPLWMAFDWALAGDPLYSLHTLQRYKAYLGASATPPGRYWGEILFDARQMFHGGLLAAGGLGLLAGIVGAADERELRGHLYFLAVVLVPVLGYWAVSWVTDVVLHVRFFSPALVVLYLYAPLLPLLMGRATGRAAAAGAGPERTPGATGAGAGRRAAGSAASPVGAVAGATEVSVPVPRPRRAAASAVAAAWAVVCIALGWSMDGWRKARDVSADRARNDRARRAAVEVLRRSWLDGGRPLLAGRSIEYLGLALGEEASRRMHQLRMVAGGAPPVRELAPGHAVWIRGDVGGLGLELSFLAWPGVHRERGVEFRSVAPLTGERGDTLGVVHSFTAVSGDGGDAERGAPGTSAPREAYLLPGARRGRAAPADRRHAALPAPGGDLHWRRDAW